MLSKTHHRLPHWVGFPSSVINTEKFSQKTLVGLPSVFIFNYFLFWAFELRIKTSSLKHPQPYLLLKALAPQWSAPTGAGALLWERSYWELCNFSRENRQKCELELNHTVLTLLPTREVSLTISIWVLSQRPHKLKLCFLRLWCTPDDLFDLYLITSLPVQDWLSEACVELVSFSPKSETFACSNFIPFFDFFFLLA